MFREVSGLLLCSRLLHCLAFALLSTAAMANAEEQVLPFEVPEDYRELPATALIETSQGAFEIEFYRRTAPTSVANFEYIGRKGILNGTSFHRYVPEFVIQGGDPTHTGKGGPGWSLPPEISADIKHVRGSLGWARLPAEVNPGRTSNGSQFYITLSPAPGLDGFYTVFARVIRGFPNVMRLRKGDTITAVRFPKKKKTKPLRPSAP